MINLEIKDAFRVHQYFNYENVDIILVEDKTFLSFIEVNSKVVVPCGSKLIGTTLKYNEKKNHYNDFYGYEFITNTTTIHNFQRNFWKNINTIMAKILKKHCFIYKEPFDNYAN